MRRFFLPILILLLSNLSAAQKPDDVLASGDGITITASELSPDSSEAYSNYSEELAKTKKALLESMVDEILLDQEARARAISVEELLQKEVSSKVPDPSDEEIARIYEINRVQIGNRTLEEMMQQISAFLRRDSENAVYQKFIETLRGKAKPAFPKPLSNSLKPADVVGMIGTKQITYADFVEKNGAKIADFEAHEYDHLRSAVENAAYEKLIIREAAALELRPDELLAREITNKMTDFTDAERSALESSLKEKLFKKYRVQISLKEPAPYVYNVSADDDPSTGNENAKVTVIMFTDLQCPTCASVHPILKQIVRGYGADVRLVIRDFPLENLHQNAFAAAVAANAANAQGKYFEFIEILYKNQTHLDEKSLKEYAARLGLNASRFELDLKSEKLAAEVRKDMADGNLYSISGTPTIFVNGVKVAALSSDSFKRAIEKALKK